MSGSSAGPETGGSTSSSTLNEDGPYEQRIDMTTPSRREQRVLARTSGDTLRRARAIASERGPDNIFRRTVGRYSIALDASLRRCMLVKPHGWFAKRRGDRDRSWTRLSWIARRTSRAIERHEQWEGQTKEIWTKLSDSQVRAALLLHDIVGANFDAEARRCMRLVARHSICASFAQASTITTASLSSLARLTALCDRFEQVSRDLAVVVQRYQAVDRGDLAADHESDSHLSLSKSNADSADAAIARGDLIRTEGYVKQAAYHVSRVEQFLIRGRKYASDEAESWRRVAALAPWITRIADWAFVADQDRAPSVSEWQRVRNQIDAQVNKDAAICRHANRMALGKVVRPLAWNESKLTVYERFVKDIVKLTRRVIPREVE